MRYCSEGSRSQDKLKNSTLTISYLYQNFMKNRKYVRKMLDKHLFTQYNRNIQTYIRREERKDLERSKQ